MPLENCPFLKMAYFQSLFFPCEYGFNPTKKGDKAVNVNLFTVRHVFGGIWGREESGMRNLQSFKNLPVRVFLFYLSKIILIHNIFSSLTFNCRILSRKSQKSS